MSELNSILRRATPARAVAVALWLLACAVPGAALAQRADRAQTENQLQQIRAEIERIREQVGRDAAERDRLTRELRKTEVSVAGVRDELQRLRGERDAGAKRRGELAQQTRERQKALADERAALGGQMRAAYLIGREEPLKLLLNQRDPARAGRMFAYYSYFGRARAEQIERIGEHVAKLAQLDAQLEVEQARLLELESARQQELARLERARDERGEVLTRVQAESRSRVASLTRLKREQASLEKLLRELRRTVQRFPVDSKSPFAKLRGKLTWPVQGRILSRFGQTRAGGLKWDGVLLAAERGSAVHSIYHGRVVYADWLAGLGLLVIVDHGGGYMSLYGHNDSIYRKVGERVDAGDEIAAVGDSGGRPRPELYFEIRRGGQPVDPRPWFRTAAP